jgi:molybdate transport system substrate-binding protein
MIKKITLFIALFGIVFTSCKPTNNIDKLTIATAASAQFALKKLAINFSKKHNIKVDVILGSSGKLTTQIINGAPYDLFFSADMYYPKMFNKEKTEKKPITYAYGAPVIWTMRKDIAIDSLVQLKDPSIKHLAIANPRNAPYGRKAIRYLKQKNVYKSIEHKLVYGESISQVNEYVLNKTVEVGVTAKSIVSSPKLKGKGFFKELDKEYWVKQGAVIIKNKNLPEMKKQFLEYVLSEEGKEILVNYGYSII